MNSSSSTDTQPETNTTAGVAAEGPVVAVDSHPDPITGEAGAYPVEVGVGALGAGAAGAAIGAFAGPVGALIGAAIGAIAGGLAGKEVAETTEEPTAIAEELAIAEPTEHAPLTAAPAFSSSTAVEESPVVAVAPPLAFKEPPAESYAPPASVEKIRETAYYYYLGRQTHGLPGDELSDWVTAESEVLHA